MDKLLGFPIGGGTQAPNNDSIVTLGEAGGYIIVKFDPPIKNSLIGNGFDFIVYGNSFWLGNNPETPYMEPAFVEVKSTHDDTWYLLAPEENREIIKRVSIKYNRKDYPEDQWPAGSQESITLQTWKSSNYQDKTGFSEVSPTLKKPDSVDNITFYANQDIRGGGDPFKLEWAVDQDFQSVELEEISYIKITTGVFISKDSQSSSEIDSIIRINHENP